MREKNENRGEIGKKTPDRSLLLRRDLGESGVLGPLRDLGLSIRRPSPSLEADHRSSFLLFLSDFFELEPRILASFSPWLLTGGVTGDRSKFSFSSSLLSPSSRASVRDWRRRVSPTFGRRRDPCFGLFFSWIFRRRRSQPTAGLASPNSGEWPPCRRVHRAGCGLNGRSRQETCRSPVSAMKEPERKRRKRRKKEKRKEKKKKKKKKKEKKKEKKEKGERNFLSLLSLRFLGFMEF